MYPESRFEHIVKCIYYINKGKIFEKKPFHNTNYGMNALQLIYNYIKYKVMMMISNE